MTRYISHALRQLVISRADRLCEYCLIHDDDTFFGCEVDHIISEKHGGETESSNLALACVFCNRAKGSDIGSISAVTRQFVRFYHPRLDEWGEHFILDGVAVVGRTEIGQVTARILGLNNDARMIERQALRRIGRYPSAAALTRIRGYRL